MSAAGPESKGQVVALKRRSSLRWRLLSLLAAILLFTLLIIGVGVYYFIATNEQRTWQQRREEAARYAVEVVSTFMNRTTSSLQAVSLLDQEMLDARPRLLEQLLAQNPALLEIVRLDEDGQPLASAFQDAPIIANQFTIPQSVWFRESKAGRLYLGSVQLSANSRPYMIIAAPAPDGGVVASRLRMNVLWDVVADLHFGETGQAYIVNQAGQIVAHTDPEVALARTDLSDQPGMEAVLQSLSRDWSGVYVNFENLEVAGITRPVPDTSWTIVAEVPTSEVNAISQNALILLGGGLAVFGVFVMLVTSRFLSRLILQPMERLRAGTVRIGGGDLGHQINLERQDEVGQVATAFNDMVNRLRDREETLRQQREFLQEVIDINPHFIFAKDTNLCFTLVNKAFADAYRTTVPNLIGKSDADFNPNSGLVDKFEREDRRVIETGRELVIAEEQIETMDGRLAWRKTIKRPIFDKQGRAYQVLGVATDITDRKLAEEALALARDQAVEASEFKSRLLSNVSHDLRTPLGGILGYAEMLQAGVYGELSEEQLEAVNEVIDSTNQLLTFINNLLNQARIEAGKVVIKSAPFKPVTLVADLRSMFGPLAQTKKLDFTTTISPDVPDTVLGDLDAIRQTTANLVGNAIKFTEQGQVGINIFCPNHVRWAIQVSDSGPGIPPEAQAYIFDAFRQVDGTITREHSGSGLGLSIVKEMTVLMGGEITLESELGKGSTFTIHLPLTTVKEKTA